MVSTVVVVSAPAAAPLVEASVSGPAPRALPIGQEYETRRKEGAFRVAGSGVKEESGRARPTLLP